MYGWSQDYPWIRCRMFNNTNDKYVADRCLTSKDIFGSTYPSKTHEIILGSGRGSFGGLKLFV